MDDAAAVKRVLAGDREAFADLVREHGPGVLRLAARMLPSRELAEDVAQETFLRAYSNLARYDPRYPFRSWLYRIASNLCVDALRRWKAAPSSVSIDVVAEGDVAGGSPVVLATGVTVVFRMLDARAALATPLRIAGLLLRPAAVAVNTLADLALDGLMGIIRFWSLVSSVLFDVGRGPLLALLAFTLGMGLLLVTLLARSGWEGARPVG